MKLVKTFFFCFFLALSVSLLYVFATTETHVARWSERVHSAEVIEATVFQIHQAQVYSEQVLQVTQELARLNVDLTERERLTVAYVVSLEDENNRLKNSLTEATTNLQEQVAENNELHKQLENANFRLKTLEETVKSLNEALRKVNEAQRDKSENGGSE